MVKREQVFMPSALLPLTHTRSPGKNAPTMRFIWPALSMQVFRGAPILRRCKFITESLWITIYLAYFRRSLLRFFYRATESPVS